MMATIKTIKKIRTCAAAKDNMECEEKLTKFSEDEIFYKLLCNICRNTLLGNINVNDKDKAKLKKKKKLIKLAAERKIDRKKLCQKGAGIFSILLPLALPI